MFMVLCCQFKYYRIVEKTCWARQRIVQKSIISIIVFTSMVSSSCSIQTINPFSPTDTEFDFSFLNPIVLPESHESRTGNLCCGRTLGAAHGWFYTPPPHHHHTIICSEAQRVQFCLPGGSGAVTRSQHLGGFGRLLSSQNHRTN